jgi:predicted TPR repeat methyltransferase
MELTVEQVLKRGVAAHREGRLQDAKRLYRIILQSEPSHPDANHNLGLIAVSSKQAAAALPLFKKALDANPKTEQFWISYIDALIRAKRFTDAEELLKQAEKLGVDNEKLGSLKAQIMFTPHAENSDSGSPSQQELNDLFEFYNTGHFSDAERLAVSITSRFPQHQIAWQILGAVLGLTGRKSEATAANQTVVTLSPQDAEAHYNLAYTLEDVGRHEEAVGSYAQAIGLKPDYAEAHYNLGNIFKELSRLEDAEASFNQAIASKPDFAEAYNNLGITLKELSRFEEALSSYSQAIALKPNYAEAHNNLGNMLQELGRLDESESHYRQATALEPDYVEAHSNLGNTLKELGRMNEAEATYRKVLALDPEHLSAKHWVAALTGKTTESPPRDYIERLFDSHAANLEKSLVDNLEYKIPKVIAEVIKKHNKVNTLGSIIDLGCGTGLFGTEVNQLCENLYGVDLSQKMLDKAKAKSVYDNLIKQDILDYLSNTNLNFDYFVSADVFPYLGDLSNLFRLIKSCNEKKGKLIFSTEDYDGEGFVLRQSGRYSHSKKYIQALCEKFGYEIRHFDTLALRKEKNEHIRGGLYLLDF